MLKTSLPSQDLRTVYGDLLELVNSEPERDAFLLGLLERVVSFTNALGGVVFIRDEDNDLALGPRLLSSDLIQGDVQIQQKLGQLAKQSLSDQRATVAQMQPGSDLKVVLVPVTFPGRLPEVFCIIVRTANADPFVAILQLACGYINFWEKSRSAETLDWEAGVSATAVELINKLVACPDLDELCITLVNDISQLTGCNRASIGLRKGAQGRCRLQAVSDSSSFDRRNKMSHALEGVFSECAGLGTLQYWPTSDQSMVSGLMAHKKLQNLTGAAQLISVPLLNAEGRVIAVIALWWLDTPPNIERMRYLLNALSSTLATVIVGQIQSRRRLGVGRHKRINPVYGRIIGIIMLMALLAFTATLPVAHRIKSGVNIKPHSQRIISAPFDGVIESTTVEVGNVVNKGDELASFDGREVRWKLAELRTEFDRLTKKRDISLATGDTIKSQLSALEIERVGVKIELLESQIAQLVIRSPIEGVVLNHDLERKQGSPVAKGQALIEVAPLNQLILEVEIPVEDISYVNEQMLFRYHLDAFPRRDWSARLSPVLPQAMIRDARTVFISEIKIENDHGLLPGMSGSGHLYAGERALAWILFHRPMTKFRHWMGWHGSNNDASLPASHHGEMINQNSNRGDSEGRGFNDEDGFNMQHLSAHAINQYTRVRDWLLTHFSLSREATQAPTGEPDQPQREDN